MGEEGGMEEKGGRMRNRKRKEKGERRRRRKRNEEGGGIGKERMKEVE